MHWDYVALIINSVVALALNISSYFYGHYGFAADASLTDFLGSMSVIYSLLGMIYVIVKKGLLS